MSFPVGSDNKQSACNAGDLGWILGLGSFPGGGHGNPLQYLVAQLVKNLPAMQETLVQSLGRADPPEKGTAAHSSGLENSMGCA